MFTGFTQRLNFGMGNGGGGTVSVPSAFPVRPIAQLGNFNSFAVNFLNVTGITDVTQQIAINALSNDLVNSGLMNKMVAVYPFVGGTSTTHKYNLKDPRDANAAFRISFVGGWTHSSTGILPNGTNAYALTYVNGLTNLPQTNMHLSIYSRTVSVGVQVELGLDDNVAFQRIRAAADFISGNGTGGQGQVAFTTNTNAQGYWIGSKTNTSTRFGFRNGVLNSLVTTTNDITQSPNLQFYISARNNSNSPITYSTKELAFISIGLGLSQAECSVLNTIVQNYQKILGRNV